MQVYLSKELRVSPRPDWVKPTFDDVCRLVRAAAREHGLNDITLERQDQDWFYVVASGGEKLARIDFGELPNIRTFVNRLFEGEASRWETMIESDGSGLGYSTSGNLAIGQFVQHKYRKMDGEILCGRVVDARGSGTHAAVKVEIAPGVLEVFPTFVLEKKPAPGTTSAYTREPPSTAPHGGNPHRVDDPHRAGGTTRNADRMRDFQAIESAWTKVLSIDRQAPSGYAPKKGDVVQIFGGLYWTVDEVRNRNGAHAVRIGDDILPASLIVPCSVAHPGACIRYNGFVGVISEVLADGNVIAQLNAQHSVRIPANEGTIVEPRDVRYAVVPEPGIDFVRRTQEDLIKKAERKHKIVINPALADPTHP